MNILSLFDGMSCGQIALNRVGIKYDNYFASEIDKHAIKVTQHNYPNTVQLGSVVDVKGEDLPKIDLMFGGSPCQSFSFAGKRNGMSTVDNIEITTLEQYLDLKKYGFEFNGQSYLFWEYVRILHEVKPKYFLLENVKMAKKWKDVISKTLGTQPIEINSNLVSAQNRQRLYWTNIPNITQIPDKNIFLNDILEYDVPKKYFYSELAISYLDRNKINKRFAIYSDELKFRCITANFCKSLPYNVFVNREKSNCITSNYANMACINYNKSQGQIVFVNDSIRKLTPNECERLQTVPENYTNVVSDSQRYRMLGNGWTVDVIAHIFKSIINPPNTFF